MKRIKNRDKLTKEDLIISLLKSESSDAERNCMKHFNNNTDDDDDTYDDKIRGKISNIRMIVSRLGNTVTNNGRKKELIYCLIIFKTKPEKRKIIHEIS